MSTKTNIQKQASIASKQLFLVFAIVGIGVTFFSSEHPDQTKLKIGEQTGVLNIPSVEVKREAVEVEALEEELIPVFTELGEDNPELKEELLEKIIEVVDKVEIEEPLQEVVEVSQKAPVSFEFQQVDRREENDFYSTATALGVKGEIADAMISASEQFSIDPRYLLTIGLTENVLNPSGIGDNGCSFGVYQGNICAGRGRHGEVHFGLGFKECMLDYLCSSKWTAQRIANQYCGSSNCNSWIIQLSRHQGTPADSWYRAKIEKNGLKSGLSY